MHKNQLFIFVLHSDRCNFAHDEGPNASIAFTEQPLAKLFYAL